MQYLDAEALEAMTAADTFVPENLRPGLQRFIESGIPVGSFLDAVLRNDLTNAVLRADPITFQHLPTVVRWLHNFAPANCHGNENHVVGWMDARQHDARAQQ